MTSADYDAWYDIPRGHWSGYTEYRLLRRLSALQPRETLLDVGCGIGWFTRRFAATHGGHVTGLDRDAEHLAYARAHCHATACVFMILISSVTPHPKPKRAEAEQLEG